MPNSFWRCAMSGSSFGNLLRITTWGESHGPAIGVVVDGCPAGLSLCEEDIQVFLDRRKPGQNRFATPRKEDDRVSILSGVFDGKTTGCPISLAVANTSMRPSDYREIASYYRPGHADFTYDAKYGFRDYRGGGRASGRETIGRVAAGAIAAKLLRQIGIDVWAYTAAIGPISVDRARFDRTQVAQNPLYMPDQIAAREAASYLDACRAELDSAGGYVECVAEHMVPGLGDPVFEKLGANLAKAICSIGAVKSFEIGDGAKSARARGSENNDAFLCAGGAVVKKTNHAGGILGGISDGSDLFVRVGFKPTPSIARRQQTVSTDKSPLAVQIKGRHDPVIVPRAVVVVESMVALTLADALLANMSARMEHVERFYRGILPDRKPASQKCE